MITGSRIKERRLQLGLSADQLAEMNGKNRVAVYRYEGDEIENFPLPVIVPLAEALHTSPAYLMGWTDDPSEIISEPTRESEPEKEEFIRLFSSLGSENQKRILDLMRVLVEGQESMRDHQD